MGKVVQPLQRVNYHDSRARGHERRGPFTRLVGVFAGLGSSWFGSCYATGAKPVGIVSWLSCRWDACVLVSILATGVTPVSLWPLVAVE